MDSYKALLDTSQTSLLICLASVTSNSTVWNIFARNDTTMLVCGLAQKVILLELYAIVVSAVLFVRGQLFVVTSTCAWNSWDIPWGLFWDSGGPQSRRFPLNVFTNPMYVGNTMCFAATALWFPNFMDAARPSLKLVLRSVFSGRHPCPCCSPQSLSASLMVPDSRVSYHKIQRGAENRCWAYLRKHQAVQATWDPSGPNAL
ncbi:hypothetical protein C8J56DRAFT_892827 [Mycena floridula]|nr:hypothetical protein C8J56DRAFT_892827 [Mycena floridula]